MTNTKEKAVLTDEETLKEIVDCLKENISIKTQSDCQQSDLFNILVGAASRSDTIENTADSLKNSWSGRNVRYHLSKIDQAPSGQGKGKRERGKGKTPEGIGYKPLLLRRRKQTLKKKTRSANFLLMLLSILSPKISD